MRFAFLLFTVEILVCAQTRNYQDPQKRFEFLRMLHAEATPKIGTDRPPTVAVPRSWSSTKIRTP